MALKESVFGSKSEERVFDHLKSVCGDKIKVYHNLPFFHVFEFDTIDLSKFTKNVGRWKKFLLMTSIDFVVCNEKNKPLICIEFDGMTGAYNKGTEVFQDREDKKRKEKLELKLKIAKDHNFPFYIISCDEVWDLSKFEESDIEFLNLTVVDGIIGQTMKNELLQSKVEEHLDGVDLDSMGASEEYDYIQDEVISTEVELELEWDPIKIKAAEIQSILYEKGIISSVGHRFVHKPELPDIKGMDDYEGLEKRINAMRKVEWQGCKVFCETIDGEINKEAWIRNFDGMGVSPLAIAQNISDLLIFSK